ncbi:ABC transporter permease [Fodinicurvata halophila]|uniref:ABC transporter permease n=1 Tax=Fodinicurvata halophila TaxID=1419723 RepID=A0ABV8ULD1_9PROT
MDSLIIQLLTGLASASSLFLVASGLTIIFGVTRVVNFAHGSLYMLSAYIAVTLIQLWGGQAGGFWLAVLVAILAVALIGGLLEITVLRRLYRSPELFQLLATFGVVLIVQDVALAIWGPQDRFGVRPPGLDGAYTVLGRPVPTYDIFLIVLAPLVLLGLWLLFNRTRWGALVRAATEDPEMLSALGINQRWLLTAVFALGSMLAGLGGALELPKGSANLSMDMQIIASVFVVVVVGGMGSILGAYLAAVLVSLIRTFAISNAQVSLLGITVWQLELVSIFIVMAVVLVLRPWGLLGRPEALHRGGMSVEATVLRPPGRWHRLALGVLVLLLFLLPAVSANSYLMYIVSEMAVFALFAASLQFLMGLGGVISFGHAAYFGLGAYGAALAFRHLGLPMETALLAAPLLAGLGGLVFGWFCVRLSGVYLAMLTLAFAQIAWSIVFQWDSLTGGDNGLLGIWPSEWASDPVVFYYLVLGVVLVCLFLLRRFAYAPFGYTLRAGRDSPLRAEAIGIDVRQHRWLAFTLAAIFAGVAGGLFVFLKGSVSPDAMAIPQSVDALAMVLLGGVQSLTGPLFGAAIFTGLKAELMSLTNYWRFILGSLIVLLCVLFPRGIAGAERDISGWWPRRRS